MSEEGYRLIDASFIVYYKKIGHEDLSKESLAVREIESYEDSFNFLMAQNNIDSSFDSLNKAFVIMMKEIDAKLNYLISLVRDKQEKDKFINYNKTYACSVSASEINFVVQENLSVGDLISTSFFLPISSHNEVKVVAEVTKVDQKNDKFCAKAKFLDISKKNQELIIYYGLALDRERLKSRQLEL